MKRSLLILLVFTLVVLACTPKTNEPMVSTYAGNGELAAQNGKANEASFANPVSLAVDSNENVYVADSRNNQIRKIGADGEVSTIAGTIKAGNADGKGQAASFFYPCAITVDGKGNLYVADTENSLIRKITPDGMVTTIAGALTPGNREHPQDSTRLDNPRGILIDHQGNLIVTDWAKDIIRKITPDGKMTTIAGTGEPGAQDGIGRAASFYLPEGIAMDSKGNLFIADTYNNMIRKMDPQGNVTTFAGKPAPKGKRNRGKKDGKGPAASFSHPSGIGIDNNDIIYVGDDDNHKIRRITPDGMVTTIAGTGHRGADNGIATKASFYRPTGLAVDKKGNVFIADFQNNMVRKLTF